MQLNREAAQERRNRLRIAKLNMNTVALIKSRPGFITDRIPLLSQRVLAMSR
jgi:hypothetical protein